MMNRHDAELALGKALSRGGDFAEIFLQDELRNAVSMVDGSIETATTLRIHGAGVRVLDGLGCVYAHTCDTSLAGLLRAAGQVADALAKNRTAQIAPCANAYVAPAHLPGAPGERKAELLRRANRAARDVDAAVSQVRLNLIDRDAQIVIVNSEGLFTGENRRYTRFLAQAVASDGTENQTGVEGPGASMGYEFFDKTDVEESAREAARTASTMLRAEPCPAGEMPVAIDGGFGGVIFHEACGHSLEATSVALGNSEFCGMLGKPIASSVVTAIDDGTIPGAWGSIGIDDEGTKANRLVLIENGILKNYMIDKLNGRRMGMESTGSARRQSYEYQPTSRMRNTYIAPGPSTDEEIIATMGDGLYARKMGGGSVNPVTGQFNFSVSEGYLVRGGKIDRPVRGATLVGKGGEILMRIDKVGNNLRLAQGMCGSVSGSIPVCVGQPMIRVSRVTVGGRA